MSSLPAARQGDPHGCPAHGPSPLLGPCCAKVLIGNHLAARKGDFAVCPPGPDIIVKGSRTVLIGGQQAARATDGCAHGGTIVQGFSTVLIGDPPVDADGRAFNVPPECAFLKDFGKKATGGDLDRLRDGYTQRGPTPVYVTIPGDSQPTAMLVRDVVIRGHHVMVYEPAGGAPAGKWLPSGDSVAQGLATLSDEQLRNTKNVYVVPHDGPDNAVADYKDGTIRYFPRNESHPQSDVDWALQHESGHAYSISEVWAKDPAARDASARALFPNRCREMDKLFPHGLPAYNPGGAGKPY